MTSTTETGRIINDFKKLIFILKSKIVNLK